MCCRIVTSRRTDQTDVSNSHIWSGFSFQNGYNDASRKTIFDVRSPFEAAAASVSFSCIIYRHSTVSKTLSECDYEPSPRVMFQSRNISTI